MILDNIKNLKNYPFADGRLLRALEYLRDTDFSALPDSTCQVDGSDLYYFVQTYETRPANDTPEAHRQYVDIQYVLSGTECMGVGQLEQMTEEVEARPQKDIWFYHGPMDTITVSQGMFAVFFPNDVHAPCVSPASGANTVRKCVFKVKL